MDCGSFSWFLLKFEIFIRRMYMNEDIKVIFDSIYCDKIINNLIIIGWVLDIIIKESLIFIINNEN